MEPITRNEIFLANAAGQSSGDLPTPVTREEAYLEAVCDKLDNIVFIASDEIPEVLHG